MFKYLLRRLNLFLATSLVMVGVLFTPGLFPGGSHQNTHSLAYIHRRRANWFKSSRTTN